MCSVYTRTLQSVFFSEESQVLMFTGLNMNSEQYAQATGVQPPGASHLICVCAGFLLSRRGDFPLLKDRSILFFK